MHGFLCAKLNTLILRPYYQLKLELSAHLATQRLQADNHRVQILALPQVDALEGLLGGDTEVLGAREEGRDVLHALEGHFAVVDLLDGAGLQGVGQLAQDDAILEHLEEVVGVAGCVNGLLGDGLDPLEALLGQLLAVLGVNLQSSQTVDV